MTLNDLLSPRNRETLEGLLMSVLQGETIEGMPGVGFPVTDWQPGSFERTHMKMIATGLLDREETIRMLTASGFLGLASTLVDADGNPVEGWMELLASQNYLVDHNVATYSKQLLTLTCTTGPGPYTRAAGELVAYSPATGNKYVLVAEVTIPDGGSVTAVFQAESPGVGYQDSIGSIVSLVTPLPGVSVVNAATPAGVPASYLTGSGSIAVSSTVITTSPRTLKLTFTTGGRVDGSSAAFMATLYQAGAVTTVGPFTASGTFTQGDLELAITDGGAGTQSFNAGDEWIVGVPGTPIVQVGSDKETMASLAQRCRDTLPARSVVPTASRYAGMVRDCEAAQHLGVVKIVTRPSLVVAGIEDVYIAGTTATATPTQVAAVQAYLDARSAQVDFAAVHAAEALAVSVGGTIYCRRRTTAAVKAAADIEWARYIAELPIGGEQPGGLVKLLALADIMADAGAFNAFALRFNGTVADLPLTALQCATLDESAGLPSTGMTWLEVA